MSDENAPTWFKIIFYILIAPFVLPLIILILCFKILFAPAKMMFELGDKLEKYCDDIERKEKKE